MDEDKKIYETGLEIKKLAEKVTETNKKLDDAYDEKIKSLEDKRKMVPDEKKEEIHEAKISALKEKLAEIKSRISKARKAGKDPFIADLWLRNVNAKIKIAEATREEKDFKTVENILNYAEQELKQALKEEEVDVKKEIKAKLRKDIAKETGKVIEA